MDTFGVSSAATSDHCGAESSSGQALCLPNTVAIPQSCCVTTLGAFGLERVTRLWDHPADQEGKRTESVREPALGGKSLATSIANTGLHVHSAKNGTSIKEY